MGLFDIFKKKRKARADSRPTSKRRRSQSKQMIEEMSSSVENLQSQIGTIHIAIKKQDDRLAEHEARLQEHGQNLQTLEQKIGVMATQPLTPRHLVRRGIEQDSCTSWPALHSEPPQQLDINRFSEQEKRILAVFFQNKAMRMSYVDVARALNKSACTVKNQMNQIRHKADLFDCAVGHESRNLFKLKDDLRVEKYLKVGQPVERPLPTPPPDQPDNEKERATVECTVLRSGP
jgi:hypothetical protein